MNSINSINTTIEGLRCDMISTAEKTGNLCDPEVVRISQQLDTWIVLAQLATFVGN